MDEWIIFYEPFFQTRGEAQRFVETLERLGIEDSRHPAKIMMHQTQRLVSLADDIVTIRPGTESLQVLFLVICAEHVAKLHDNFEEEGRSRAYVRNFFDNHLSDEDKQELRSGFSKLDRRSFELREISDLLYEVRCDVVHEGEYWNFSFYDGIPMLNVDPDVIVSCHYNELRALIVRGCINAANSYPGRPNQAMESDA